MESQVKEKIKLKNRFVIFFQNMKKLFHEKDEESKASLEETFPEEDRDTLKALESCQEKVVNYEVQHQKVIDAIEKMSKSTVKVPKARTTNLSSEKLEKAKKIVNSNNRSKEQDDNELSR